MLTFPQFKQSNAVMIWLLYKFNVQIEAGL